MIYVEAKSNRELNKRLVHWEKQRTKTKCLIYLTMCELMIAEIEIIKQNIKDS